LLLLAVYLTVVVLERQVFSEKVVGRYESSGGTKSTARHSGTVRINDHHLSGAAAKALQLIPQLTVETFDSTCCGMAGSFGLEAEHYEVSMKIGELGVLPKMRAASPETLLAACGTSCRHQIAEGAGRQARHIVRILDEASEEPLSRTAGEGGAVAKRWEGEGGGPSLVPITPLLHPIPHSRRKPGPMSAVDTGFRR